MTGIIGIEELKIECIIGVLPEERKKGQTILIDLRAEAGFPMQDSLSDTVDYVALATQCRITAQEGKYHLLETLAADLTQILLQQFHLTSVWIKIRKPGALATANCAFVEFKRNK